MQITTHSVVEANKFLLQEGVEYILTERFCQDVIQEYFGSQQKIRRRNDNPDIQMFGYRDSTIRIQQSVKILVCGHTRGKKDERKAWVNARNDALPKKKEEITTAMMKQS